MKNEPLKHLHFDLLRSPLEEQPFRYEVARIAAQVADLTDRAITEAMIAAAQHEGLTDLYLIDRQFLFEAIKEKVEREKNEPLTLDELLEMDGEPVYSSKKKQWFSVIYCDVAEALVLTDRWGEAFLPTILMPLYRSKPEPKETTP